MSEHRVRLAGARDQAALLDLLERAFVADPFVEWLVGSRRPRARQTYFRTVLGRVAMPHGAVYLTDDTSSAALWIPPGCWQLSLGAYVGLLPAIVRVIGFGRLREVTAALGELERRRPPGPWFMLALLATEPSQRKRGLASAVLAPVLEECDAEGVGAVLDTCVADNVRWYEQRGFEVSAETRLGADGPTCWSMIRPA
jgi:GNAT superfamily N-acetyltransferase